MKIPNIRWVRWVLVFLFMDTDALRVHATPPPGYTQVWADDFNGTSLDQTFWSLTWPGVHRKAFNTLDAVDVADGNLTITTYTKDGIHYTGHLDTRKKYQPLYGYMEARIQFVNQPGNWSAFWMWIDSVGKGPDPHLCGTEMDIAEHRVVDKAGTDISNQIPSAVHWDGYEANHKRVKSGLRGEGLATGFHIYAMEWTPDSYRFTIDGGHLYEVVNSTNINPVPPLVPVSRRSEALMLSTEVKDLNWAGNIPAGGYGSKATSISKMTVDYVRVYQRNPVTPAVPIVTVVHAQPKKIKLSWPVVDNGTSYRVKRSSVSGGPYVTIATCGVGFADMDITEGKTYHYVVSALNGTVESANSAQVSARVAR